MLATTSIIPCLQCYASSHRPHTSPPPLANGESSHPSPKPEQYLARWAISLKTGNVPYTVRCERELRWEVPNCLSFHSSFSDVPHFRRCGTVRLTSGCRFLCLLHVADHCRRRLLRNVACGGRANSHPRLRTASDIGMYHPNLDKRHSSSPPPTHIICISSKARPSAPQ